MFAGRGSSLQAFLVPLLFLCVFGSVNDPRQQIRVHIISHSHDDVGWLKTPLQYYHGWNNTIQHANVRLTYDSVFASLLQDPSRRFTVVEMAFFSKWFTESTSTTQAAVRGLVRNGQIIFAGGGWVSHDEATPYFADMLQQTTLGHRFLRTEFGAEVAVQWQIDPFGHSAGQATLFSQDAGIHSIFVSRIDYQEFSFRQRNQAREFWWAPSPSRGMNAAVLMGTMLHSTYCPPIDFNLDVLLPEPEAAPAACAGSGDGSLSSPCSSDPTNTLDEWISKLTNLLVSDLSVTGGQDVMMTMGCDFTHMQAETWFASLDRTMRAAEAQIAQRPGSSFPATGAVWSIFYSTPQNYAANVSSRLRSAASAEIRTGDFLPYSDGPHMFWSGFYTSRSSLKRLVRASSSLLHALQIIRTQQAVLHPKLSSSLSSSVPSLRALEEAVAQSQHHDAVSGTAKQHVTFDYARTLAAGAEAAVASMAESLGLESLEYAPRAHNSTECGACRNASFSALVFNPSSSAYKHLLRVPVSCIDPVIRVSGGLNASLGSVSTAAVFDPVSDYARAPGSATQPFISFAMVHLPPMQGLVLHASCAGDEPHRPLPDEIPRGGPALTERGGAVENAFVRIDFDDRNRIVGITNKGVGKGIALTQEWCFYVSSTGDNMSSQASGAYIFRPASAMCHPVAVNASLPLATAVIASSGPVIIVSQNISDWISQTIYVREDSADIEIEVTVGPVDTSDGLGKEVVMRLTTNMTNSTFFTDANGLELHPRLLNARPFPFRVTEPIAGNYYPVVAAAALVDAAQQVQMTVVVDTTTGGASLADGAMELMLHRVLLVDDGRGVGEPLNETERISAYVNCEWSKACGVHSGPAIVVRKSLLLFVEAPSLSAWRQRAHDVYAHPLMLFTAAAVPEEVAATWTTDDGVINATALPAEAEIVSLELMPGVPLSVFIRIAHRSHCNSFSTCSEASLQVDLQQLFRGRISSAERRLITDQGPYATVPEANFGTVPADLRRPAGSFAFPIATLMPIEIHAYRVFFPQA
jgi:lysosomal alpha-mannosidase